MLRSLVGSEMCIRDRIDVVLSREQGGGGLGPDRVSGLVRAFAGGITRTCLLYTSDAADDLLCVDLGGRRIIKKKKKR